MRVGARRPEATESVPICSVAVEPAGLQRGSRVGFDGCRNPSLDGRLVPAHRSIAGDEAFRCSAALPHCRSAGNRVGSGRSTRALNLDPRSAPTRHADGPQGGAVRLDDSGSGGGRLLRERPRHPPRRNRLGGPTGRASGPSPASFSPAGEAATSVLSGESGPRSARAGRGEPGEGNAPVSEAGRSSMGARTHWPRSRSTRPVLTPRTKRRAAYYRLRTIEPGRRNSASGPGAASGH